MGQCLAHSGVPSVTKFWCFNPISSHTKVTSFTAVKLNFYVIFLYTLYYRAFYGKKDTLSNIPLYCNSFQKFSFSSDWVKYNILVLSINICLMLILFCLFVICWSICARIALKLWQMTSQPTRECGVCVANVRI